MKKRFARTEPPTAANPRRVALDVMATVLAGKRNAQEALDQKLRQLCLGDADRALAQELLHGDGITIPRAARGKV